MSLRQLDRVQGWSAVIFVFYLALIALNYRAAWSFSAAPPPVMGDFNTFYAASTLMWERPAADAYDIDILHPYELATPAHGDVPPLRWMYPPPFFLFVGPLSRLPYLAAWACWLGLTALPFLYALRQVGKRFILPGLAQPVVFMQIVLGQNGFLSGGLLGLGLGLLRRRPVAAGLCLGLCIFKPQLGLLVPVALVAGGYWRSILAAATAAAAFAGVSAVAFGGAAWQQFYSLALTASRLQMQENGAGMPSVYVSCRLLGLDLAASNTVQAVCALLAVLAVVRLWRRPETNFRLQVAGLCAATFLASPFFLAYDLVLLAVGMMWLAADMAARGRQRWEVAVFAFAAVIPVVGPVLAIVRGIPIAPVAYALLLWVILRRALLKEDTAATA